MQLEIEGKMRNVAYFIPIMARQADGWQVGIAVEDVSHFYMTDYRWDCSHEDAVRLAKEQNEQAGISEEEAEAIMNSGVLASCLKKG